MQTIERTFLLYKSEPSEKNLSALLKSSENFIFNACYSVLRNHHDAQDTTQIILLKIMKVVDGIEDWAYFKNFVYRIAVNKSISLQRSISRRRVREQKSDSPLNDRCSSSPRDELVTLAIHEHIERLDEEYKALIKEYYFKGRSLRDIGELRGCSYSKVHKQLGVARNLLKRMLNKRRKEQLEHQVGKVRKREQRPDGRCSRGFRGSGTYVWGKRPDSRVWVSSVSKIAAFPNCNADLRMIS